MPTASQSSPQPQAPLAFSTVRRSKIPSLRSRSFRNKTHVLQQSQRAMVNVALMNNLHRHTAHLQFGHKRKKK